jgi:hypothetical protein
MTSNCYDKQTIQLVGEKGARKIAKVWEGLSDFIRIKRNMC